MSRRVEYTLAPPQRNESDGFDYPDGIPISYNLHRLRHFECEGSYPKYPYGSLVKFYAMVGLHRYNVLEGKNLQLDTLKSFNMRINCGASSYYITLAARVPDSGLKQIFQVLVHEERLGSLDMTCTIARPRGKHVKESELRDNDWIRLYLELTLVAHDRFLTVHYLSQLEIVKVAIEEVEQPNASLNTKTTFVYITYKDLAKAQIGEPVDRKAIVRKIINETTGLLRLRGDYWSGERSVITPEEEYMLLHGGEKVRNNEQRSKKLKRRVGVHRLWRWWYQAYKNRGLRSSSY
ncbi:F2E2.16 [Arabidopsis thaliana]|nr:F2E2.16 [Arabidopsis thaliana]